jgi:hypothetical protein
MIQSLVRGRFKVVFANVMLVLGIHLLGLSISEHVLSFMRWDYAEFIYPIFSRGMQQLFCGYLPLWNGSQHLGESILGLLASSVLYPVFVLAYLINELFGLNSTGFGIIAYALHQVILISGLVFFLRALKVRLFFVFLSVTSLSCLPLTIVLSIVWPWSLAVQCWLPWILFAFYNIAHSNSSLLNTCFLAVFTAMSIVSGHGQFSTYCLLLAWGSGTVYVLFQQIIYGPKLKPIVAKLGFITLSAMCGIAFSAPVLFPFLKYFGQTRRSSALPFEYFVNWGYVALNSFIGFLSPLEPIQTDHTPITISLYPGPWALVGMILVFLWAFRRQHSWGRSGNMGWIILSSSVTFFLFSLGGQTPIYGLTYGIPIWNSFRNPVKFCYFALPAFIIAATLLCESTFQETRRRWFFTLNLLVGLAFFGLSVYLIYPSLYDSSHVTNPFLRYGILIPALIFPLLIPFLSSKSVQGLLLACNVIAGISSVAISHNQNLKHYPLTHDAISYENYKINPEYRVLPIIVSLNPRETTEAQHLALYQFATSWGLRDVFGRLPPHIYPRLLTDEQTKRLNLRYLLAHKSDSAALDIIKNFPNFKQIHTFEDVFVFEHVKAFPRAFFLNPDDGQITKSKWIVDHRADFTFDLDSANAFIVSEMYDPDWRIATDKGILKPQQHDGLFLRFDLPADTTKATLYYSAKDFWYGVVVFLLGWLPFPLLIIRRGRNKSSVFGL